MSRIYIYKCAELAILKPESAQISVIFHTLGPDVRVADMM